MATRGKPLGDKTITDLPDNAGTDGIDQATLQAICRSTISQWASRRGLALREGDLDDLIGGSPSGPRPILAGHETRQVEATEPAQNVTKTTGRTIETILESASRVFLKQGFGANLNDIASDAGVTKPTIYSHFKSKRDLFVASITKMSNELVPRMPMDSETGDLFSDLIAYARIYRTISLSDKSLDLFRILLSNIPSIPHLAHDVGAIVMPEMTNSLSAYFARAIETGKVRRLNPHFLALQFFALADGHARTWKLLGLPGPQGDSEAYLQQSVECFVRGIEPETAS